MDFERSFHHAKSLYFAFYVLPLFCVVVFFSSPVWVALVFAGNLITQHDENKVELIQEYNALNEEYLTTQKHRAGGFEDSYDKWYYDFAERALAWDEADYAAKQNDDESIFTNVIKPFFYFCGILVFSLIVVIIYKSFYMFMWHTKWRIPFLMHLVYSTCSLYSIAVYDEGRLKIGYADSIFALYHPLTLGYCSMHIINIAAMIILFLVFLKNGLWNSQEYYDAIKAEKERRKK